MLDILFILLLVFLAGMAAAMRSFCPAAWLELVKMTKEDDLKK